MSVSVEGTELDQVVQTLAWEPYVAVASPRQDPSNLPSGKPCNLLDLSITHSNMYIYINLFKFEMQIIFLVAHTVSKRYCGPPTKRFVHAWTRQMIDLIQ